MRFSLVCPHAAARPRRAARKDLDRDNDGVPDARDACVRGRLGFRSTRETDFDGDGCEDAVEDADDDGDGVRDDDECARARGRGRGRRARLLGAAAR